ncbi:MAG TPA: class II fructose-bisphosphate aldolase [Candidatus Binataceae bacterium]|nr:class II fructose-bisphosphate aldolase [Candidatus Binataceae bacterium]
MKTLKDVLQDVQRDHVAIGHFNFSDLVAFKAVCLSARELNLPVMVGVSEGERAFVGVHQAAALVRSVREEFGQTIFLNADHTHSLAKAEEVARAGFDEIIFDGSGLPLEENIVQTKQAVETVKSINPAILVEGEVGWIGASSEILEKAPEGVGVLTTPEEAAQFVAATKVDVLAPAVGNMHGLLQSMVHGQAEKRLDIKRIAEIKTAASVFMTLHGGSGTHDEDFQQAIRAGMNIVHVNTELRFAWRGGMERALQAQPGEVAPYKILPPVVQDVSEVVKRRLRLFSFR